MRLEIFSTRKIEGPPKRRQGNIDVDQRKYCVFRRRDRTSSVARGTSKNSYDAPLPTPRADSDRKRSKRYRIRKEFDFIDRDEFRQKSFSAIKEFFRRSTDELNEIGDPIRARFEEITGGEFTCTVLNKTGKNREAHITVRDGDEGPFANSITYSYSRRGNSINGFITIEANEYELYLKSDGFRLPAEARRRTNVRRGSC